MPHIHRHVALGTGTPSTPIMPEHTRVGVSRLLRMAECSSPRWHDPHVHSCARSLPNLVIPIPVVRMLPLAEVTLGEWYSKPVGPGSLGWGRGRDRAARETGGFPVCLTGIWPERCSWLPAPEH